MNININYLPIKTRNLLEKLSAQSFIKKFYLTDGTATALFLNHRRSDDLDFFSEKSFKINILIADLKKIGKFQSFQSFKDNLVGEIDNIKISFFYLPYKLLNPPIKYKNLMIAQLVDLALMKILSISQRGAKRDFIDLYFLCQKIKPLDDFLKFFPKKFGKFDFNIYHIIKSLSYFEDAEKDKMPKMYTDIDWEEIKKFFKQEKTKLIKEFLI